MNAFEFGKAARKRGCWRVLANPASDEESREWLAGWDAADDELQNSNEHNPPQAGQAGFQFNGRQTSQLKGPNDADPIKRHSAGRRFRRPAAPTECYPATRNE